MKFKLSIIISFLVLILWGCEEYYTPELETKANALVVECLMTNKEEFLLVKVSRTVPFNDRSYFHGERNAKVYLKSTLGEVYETKEGNNGYYTTSQKVKAEIGAGYHLHIITSDGLEYKSEIETLMPPTNIDEIKLVDTIYREVNIDYWGNPFVRDFEGINFMVQPETPINKNVGFLYKWNALVNYNVYGEIPPAGYNFYCWKTMRSNIIYVYDYNEKETDNKLILDDLHFISYYGLGPLPIDSSRFFLTRRPSNKKELIPLKTITTSSVYYRLVQYTITPKGAEFWKGIKRQSEATGKLFDPVEEQLITNIYCETDPSVPAFGYFNTGASTEKIIKVTIKADDFENVVETDTIPITAKEEDCLLGEKPAFWF